jgi:hypothetical protein
MKTPNLLSVGIIILLAAGCSTAPPPQTAPWRPPARVSASSAQFVIVSAVYGSGTKFADVTARADDLLHQPEAEFYARPEWLKTDPTPGWNKALVIVYERNNERRIFTAGEGGKVSLDRLMQPQAKAKRKRKK